MVRMVPVRRGTVKSVVIIVAVVLPVFFFSSILYFYFTFSFSFLPFSPMPSCYMQRLTWN